MVKGGINNKVNKRESKAEITHRWTNIQKIDVEGIVVFENLLASLVFQKYSFCCLQRLR